MVEKVEKVAEGTVPVLANPLLYQRGVVPRQHAGRTDETETRKRQFDHRSLVGIFSPPSGALDTANGTGQAPAGKAKREGSPQPHWVLHTGSLILAADLRGSQPCHSGSPRRLFLDRLHGSKDLECFRGSEKSFNHTITRFPARGGHRHSSPRLSR
jgi:hypothetical protein